MADLSFGAQLTSNRNDTRNSRKYLIKGESPGIQDLVIYKFQKQAMPMHAAGATRSVIEERRHQNDKKYSTKWQGRKVQEKFTEKERSAVYRSFRHVGQEEPEVVSGWTLVYPEVKFVYACQDMVEYV